MNRLAINRPRDSSKEDFTDPYPTASSNLNLGPSGPNTNPNNSDLAFESTLQAAAARDFEDEEPDDEYDDESGMMIHIHIHILFNRLI